MCYNYGGWLFGDPSGVFPKLLTSAPQVVGSIPAHGEYLYELQIIVPYLGVCTRDIFVCKTFL